MFFEPITEKTKIEISTLYQNNDLTVEEIAVKLNVSVRSVYRFKNYTSGNAEKTLMSMPEDTQIKISSSKKRQWLCKTSKCGFVTDRQGVLCPRCQRGPFASCFIEVGSPEYLDFIEKEHHIQEKKRRLETPTKYLDDHKLNDKNIRIENEKDAMTDDKEQKEEFEYECPHCHREFNGVLEKCPYCGTSLEGCECPKCHHQWYGDQDRCPNCGYEPSLF